MKGQVSRMYVKLRENRIRIRLILLLAVQTVCLIAAPAQAKIIQTYSVIPVCAQTETVRSVRADVCGKQRIRQHSFPLLLTVSAAGIAAMTLLPAVMTPVRCRVRLND